MSKVLAGHNGDISTDLVFHWTTAERKLQREEDTIKAKRKAHNKAAKNDGIDIKILKETMKETVARPVEVIIREINTRNLYRRALNPSLEKLPVLPDDMNSPDISEEDRLKNWWNHGYVASRTGEGLSEAMGSHDPNSDSGRSITAGWEEGQTVNAKGIKQKKPDARKQLDGGKQGEAETTEVEVRAEDLNAGSITATAVTTDAAPEPDATPEPEAPKTTRKGRAPGVTYWHNAEAKEVREIKDGTEPEGFVNIRKPEYTKLEKEYREARDAEFDAAAPKPTEAAPEPEEEGDAPAISSNPEDRRDPEDDAPEPDEEDDFDAPASSTPFN